MNKSDVLIHKIQIKVNRIKGLLTAGNTENRTEGVIYFLKVIFFEKINAEVKKEIVGIHTNGQEVDIIATTCDGETVNLNFFNEDILLEILLRLENIKTFADINLSI